MNASVINRFAKIVTAGSAKGRSRRLAVALPLAAVVAVGMAGCSPDGAPAAAPSASSSVAALPTASASASATATAPTTAPAATPSAAPFTAAPAPTAAPATAAPVPAAAKAPAKSPAKTPAKAPAKSPAKAPVVVKPGGGIDVRFDGLTAGRRIEAGGGTVSFSVTWTNTGTEKYDTVVPVVASRFYDGAQCGYIAPMAHGTLERKDGDVWTSLHLSQGTGMDYALSGEAVAFPLASGAGRTIEYRMRLDADNGPGVLPIEADAYGVVPAFEKLGSTLVSTEVVDSHRPKVSVQGAPGALVVGKQAAQYTVKVTNPTKGAFRKVAPVITLPTVVDPESGDSTRHFIEPGDLVVEVQDHGRWRSLAADYDCNGDLAVDTATLGRALPAGATAEYTFRVGVDKGWSTGNKFSLSFGSVADQHSAATVKVTPKVTG